MSNLKLDPRWVTGFIDGEGCFFISILKSSTYLSGWQVRARFSIGLHKKDRKILELIQNYFGVGIITTQGKNAVQFVVFNQKDFEVIISHFLNFPLLTPKKADLILWMKAIEMMKQGKHLSEKGLQEIVNNVISMSLTTNRIAKLKSAFPKTTPVKAPLVEVPQFLDNNWVSGFASAEGCFFIDIFKSPGSILGKAVRLIFKMTQHSRDVKLMNFLVSHFGCGKVSSKNESKTVLDFEVKNFDNLINIIIPFFQKYPILGIKALDFADFCKVAELIKNKVHLTEEGLEQIQKIKAGMNQGRE